MDDPPSPPIRTLQDSQKGGGSGAQPSTRSVHACKLEVEGCTLSSSMRHGFRVLGERTLQVCIHKVGRRSPPTRTPQDSQEGGGSGAQPPT